MRYLRKAQKRKQKSPSLGYLQFEFLDILSGGNGTKLKENLFDDIYWVAEQRDTLWNTSK